MNKLLDIIMGVILAIIIFSASILITLNFRPLYYYDITALQIPASSGLSEEVIRANYDVLIDYNSPFNSDKLELPSFPISENGRTHFEEVKNIFTFVWWLFLGSIVAEIALFLIKFLRLHKRRKSFGFLNIGGIIAIVAPLLLGTFIIFHWKNTFTTFHNLLFRNDYWVFDAKYDPVIKILPDQFFLHSAIMILALVLTSALCCLLLRKTLNSSNRNRKRTDET